MLRVSFGNKKLPKDTLIFNIPARVTCPGRTKFCGAKCYALKAERIYPQVLPARQANFEETRRPAFRDHMEETIRKHAHKIKRVRVHESGDFYNQAYLQDWFFIAQRFPGITFYAYTKSFHLNFDAKPGNFVLIASFDKSTGPAALANYYARKEAFSNTFTIVGKDEKANCVQDCTVCSKCWTGKGRALTVNVH